MWHCKVVVPVPLLVGMVTKRFTVAIIFIAVCAFQTCGNGLLA